MSANAQAGISVITPTLGRPEEVAGLLTNLAAQTVTPRELILVDGASASDRRTEEVVARLAPEQPYGIRYIRHGGGTAIQRNVGIDAAQGEFLAFVDDDIRLEPDFFERILAVFSSPGAETVGGVVGFRTNEGVDGSSGRWAWYRRLGLLRTWEAGRYDYATGYPINANLAAPFRGVREVDFATSSCTVWRRAVTDRGLRFDPFFADYGVLEDAHFSLRAGRDWRIWQCGEARCVHLRSPRSRANRRRLGYKAVVNYHYVFEDIAGPLSLQQRVRFWRFQAFELVRLSASAVRRRRLDDIREILGRLEGWLAVARGKDGQRRDHA